MSNPIADLPFADSRRAAALLAHWLDGNEPGQKQIIIEADDANRTPFLIMALLNLVLDVCPELIGKASEIRDRLLPLAYAEVDESLTAADDPRADDHIGPDDVGPWELDRDEPEQ
mgnify:FL=1